MAFTSASSSSPAGLRALLFGAANKLPVLRRDEFDHDYIDLLRWAAMRWVSSRSNRRASLRILSWAFRHRPAWCLVYRFSKQYPYYEAASEVASSSSNA